MMKCPKCGREYGDSIKMCPSCHVFFDSPNETEEREPVSSYSRKNNMEANPPIRSRTLRTWGWAALIWDLFMGLFLGLEPVINNVGSFDLGIFVIVSSIGVGALFVFLFAAAVLYWLENK